MNRFRSLCAGAASFVFATAVVPSADAQHKCFTYPDLTKFDYPLTRTMRDLVDGKPIKIIALGSSSTQGFGTTNPPVTSYPAQVEKKLRDRFPHSDISVVNLGKGGIDGQYMLDQVDEHVIPQKPQLVLLQIGTNTVLKDWPMDEAEKLIKDILNKLRIAGIDVILVDQQYAPRVTEKKNSEPMLALLKDISKEYGIPIYHRYEQQLRWHQKEGLPIDVFVHNDKLHMADYGAGCMAEGMAIAIDRSVRTPAMALRLRR